MNIPLKVGMRVRRMSGMGTIIQTNVYGYTDIFAVRWGNHDSDKPLLYYIHEIGKIVHFVSEDDARYFAFCQKIKDRMV